MKNLWRVLLVVLGAYLLVSAPARSSDDDVSPRPKRVAVAILSYEDKWLSYAGESFFTWELVNRFDQKYQKLWVVKGPSLSRESIRKAMSKALATGRIVDVFVSTHSYDDNTFKLAPSGERFTPTDVFEDVIYDKHREQLGLVVHVGCNNLGQAEEWITKLGFKSYVGHAGTSVGALALREFLDHWLGCSDLITTIGESNYNLTDTYTNYHLPRALYRKISGKSKYNAVMTGYGVNQELCYRGEYRRWSPY